MRLNKRIFIISVLLGAILLNLVACNKKAQPNINVNDSTVEATIQGSTDSEKLVPKLPVKDFNNYEFRILGRNDNDVHWPTRDIYAEQENGEPINDAVFKRNSFIEETYNVKIKQLLSKDPMGDATRSITAGSDDYDALQNHIQNSSSLALKNMLMDLNDIPYLDFTQPWWDTQTINDMSILGKKFFALGDINIMDNDATWVIFFNKKMYNEYKLNDPYKMVSDGKWTIDEYYNNCKAVHKDLNGDGNYDETDQWGATNQYECASALMTAAGERSVMISDSGDITFNLTNEKSHSAMEKIYALMTDKTAQIKADDFGSKYSDPWVSININIFLEGRALHYMSPLTSIKNFRNMDDEFGILPMPKYDQQQKEYYNVLQYNNCSVYTVPMTVTDLERTGIVLESLAAESLYTLTPAYYEVSLKRKITRDDESSKMLDLIFSTRIVDLGHVFNWQSIHSLCQDVVRAKTNTFASSIAKKEKPIMKDIQKTIDKFIENDR